MSLMTDTSMDKLTSEQKATKAILHALSRICDHPETGFYLGIGTETFALLTEAYASLTASTVENVRRSFRPVNAKNPYDGRCESVPELSLVDLGFVKAMESELVANQRKGDWREWSPDRMTCVDELFHHARKLKRSIQFNDKLRVKEHAADVANIAMKVNECHGAKED